MIEDGPATLVHYLEYGRRARNGRYEKYPYTVYISKAMDQLYL